MCGHLQYFHAKVHLKHLVFRNKFRLPIGVQDKVCIRFGDNKCAKLNPGKGKAAAAAVEAAAGFTGGGESQGEEGEEEAEDWDGEEGPRVSPYEIVFQVPGNPVPAELPFTNTGHAQTIDNTANNGQDNVHYGELGREGDEGLVCLFCWHLILFIFLF